jgi:hypothetical protein
MVLDPGWVSAVGGIVQAIGTIGAFGTGGYLLIREIRRDDLRRLDGLRQQASAVYGWTESVDAKVPDAALQYRWVDFSGPPRELQDESGLEFTEEMMSPNSRNPRHEEPATESTCFQIVVSNDSTAPIYDLFIEQVAMVAEKNVAPQDRLGNENRYLRDIMPSKAIVYIALLYPSARWMHHWAITTRKVPGIPLSSAASIAFTDSRGRRWHRDRKGVLSEIDKLTNPPWVTDAQRTTGFASPADH